jgi:hypothetical protein
MVAGTASTHPNSSSLISAHVGYASLTSLLLFFRCMRSTVLASMFASRAPMSGDVATEPLDAALWTMAK